MMFRQAIADARRLRIAKELAKKAIEISRTEKVSHEDALALLAGTLVFAENLPKGGFFERMRKAYRDAKQRKRVDRMVGL